MAEKLQRVDAIAQIYAQSLFELADELGGLGEIESSYLELESLVELQDSDHEFAEFMRSVVIPKDRKRESLRKIFGDGKVSDLVLRFLLVLNDKERLSHLEEIVLAYREKYYTKIGRIDVVAYTPKPMDESESSRVAELIQNALGKEAMINNQVEPGMIGGLKLRIGDQLIDASIATRLNRLREQLKRSGAETARARYASMLED